MHVLARSAVPGALAAGRTPLAREGRRRVRSGELVACVSAFALLALLMSAGHIRHGGFYYDDWSMLALARSPAHGGLLHGLWLAYGQRPGQVLYYAALDGAIGVDAPARLALASATLVLEASCLYALLRQLGLAVRHAGAVAALVLAFPFSDSVWLWGVLSLSSLAIAAYLLGVMLALRALESGRRRALGLHAASLALYVASVASYEVVAVAACLTGLLYSRAVGLRRARRRWALDVIAVALTLLATRALLPTDIATPSRVQPLAGMISHAAVIGLHGGGLAGAAALPLPGLDQWIGALALAAVLAAAFALRSALARGEQLRADLGRWLAVAAAGAGAAIAGWSVYVPAAAHYVPSAAGTVNRMNAAAAIGIALLVYAAIVLLAMTIGRLVRLRADATSVVVAALTLALLGAYLERAAGDARAWDRAAADQRIEAADLHAALPDPPPGATVFAFDAPREVGPGVPVLDTTLDLTSALRISYRRPRLLGVPLPRAATLTCGTRGARAGGVAAGYGRAYLLDVRERAAAPLTARGRCVTLVRAMGAAAGR